VNDLAFSPDGHLLAIASHDRSVRLWESATGRPVHTLAGHTKFVYALAFSPSGDRLATGGPDGTVRLWNPTTGTGTVLVNGAGKVTSLAYRPDSRVLAAGCTDKTVRLGDPATGHARSARMVDTSPQRATTQPFGSGRKPSDQATGARCRGLPRGERFGSIQAGG
jgi:WD40 repeat protein